ncbi:reverse transcriptase domain-containing protein [Tanacetum coccineum]
MYALRFEFKMTNNEAEYEAFLAGLRIAKEMEIKNLEIFADSQLMVNQVKGLFEATQPATKQYLERTNEVLKGFDTYVIEHIRRNQNKKADALGKLASMTFEHLTKEMLVEVLAKRSVSDKEVSKIEAEKGENGMTPIYEYLISGLLPEDPKEAIKAFRKLKALLKRYTKVPVDLTQNLALWTLPRNSQNETPFSFTYGLEAIIPTAASLIPENEEPKTSEKAKKMEGEKREIASINEAYYRNKLRRYHTARSNCSMFKLGDFILLSQDNKDNQKVWQGPHIISKVYKGEL